MFKRIAIFCLLSLMGCASDIKPNSIVLDYEDFGPQVVASEVVGTQWWQWQSHGESRPTQYDIRVVVYRNMSLSDVKDQYPVDPKRLKDYRYLEYDKALDFLEEKINEDIVADVTSDLKETQTRLISALGD